MTCEQQNENNSPPLLPSGLARGGREHLQQVDGSGGKAGKVPLWQVSSSASSVSSGTETKTRLRRFRIRTSLTHSGGEWDPLKKSTHPPTPSISLGRKIFISLVNKALNPLLTGSGNPRDQKTQMSGWYLRRASHHESRPTGLTRCVTPPRLACLQNVNLQPLHQQVCLRTDDMQNFYHRKDVFGIGKAVSQEDSGWRILQWAECN